MGGYQFVCGWSHPSLCGSVLPCSVCYQNCNLRAGDTWILLNPVHDQRYEEQPCFAVLCLGELCPAAVDWQLFWDLSVTIDTTLSGTEPTCPEEIGKDDLESNWWPGSCPLGLAGSPPAKGLSLMKGGTCHPLERTCHPLGLPAKSPLSLGHSSCCLLCWHTC